MDNLPGQGVHWISSRDEERPIALGDSGPEALPAETVMEVFTRNAQNFPNKNAMNATVDGVQKTWTWKQYYDDVITAGRAMMALGVEEMDAVSIIGFNSPEWLIANNGAISAGGVAAGIYTTNAAEACKYIVEHSKSRIIFVENEKHLAKFMAYRQELTSVVKFVQWSGKIPDTAVDTISWSDFMALGDVKYEAERQAREAKARPGKVCTLIYTSGTTGNPKACMISHDNVTWTAKVVGQVFKLTTDDRFVSYLPLSHIAAQMLDIHAPMAFCASVFFAQPDALRGTLTTTLKEVRPTVFLGVPRVWEKVQAVMTQKVSEGSFLKRAIFSIATGLGKEGHTAIQKGEDTPWGWGLANSLVWSKVRDQMGLDQCRVQASAAAPISRETLEFFNGLNVPVYEIYGMSECTGPQTISYDGNVLTGSAGKSIPGATMKIDKPDAEGNGEICYAGRHVMLGYLDNPIATAETIDGDGYLHSGDVGQMSDKGFLTITGRIKELIITAGGENVPPVLIENTLKAACKEVISNCMVIGDRKPYLCVLITLKTKANPNPTQDKPYPLLDELLPECIEVLKAHGSSATTVTEAQNCPKAQEYLMKQGVEVYNKTATSNAQTVKKLAILPEDFTVEGDELTGTLKLKRRIVLSKYADVVDRLYADGKE